jgi:superfamily II DNA/RNA helicase
VLMNEFRICTDVLARGIDFKGVNLVVKSVVAFALDQARLFVC